MDQHIYLINVTYIEEKNEIICYFENKEKKLAKKFTFFPFIKLPNEMNKEKIRDLLFFYNIKNFIIDENKIICKKETTLKEISKIIAKLTDKKLVVLNPQRNFLLEKDWSYFDTFIFNNGDIEKTNNLFDSPQIIFKEIPFLEALKINLEETEFIIKKIALSNLLKIKIDDVPNNKLELTEILVENLYFKNSGYILWNNNNFYSTMEFTPFGFYEKVSEIDFSPVWIDLITNNFFNIGQETINCDCCKPIKLDDENLLPSTLIEVEILSDDFFFESTSISFSNSFNKNNIGKDYRFKKKKEFWLKSIPICPLKKNQKIKIPIIDAKKLIKDDLVKLSKNHKLNWFCENKESFISKEIKNLSKKLYVLKNEEVVKQKNIFQKPQFKDYYQKALISELSLMLFEIPFQLSNPNSIFFNGEVAFAITSVQETTLSKFNEFSENKGYRVIHSNKRNAVIKGFSPLSLAKSFASELNFPIPLVSNFSNIASFR